MQVAPTGDDDYDIESITKYFGVKGRVIYPEVNPRYGVSEETMASIYNFIDVYLSTSVGEGWGLPALEAMACGTPCVLTKWSAYAEWAADAAWLAEPLCTLVAPKVGTVGALAGPEVREALSRLYAEKHSWKALSDAGLALASRPEYRWESIGARVAEVVEKVLTPDVVVYEAGALAEVALQ